jgi:hypothetical protein
MSAQGSGSDARGFVMLNKTQAGSRDEYLERAVHYCVLARHGIFFSTICWEPQSTGWLGAGCYSSVLGLPSAP